MPYSYPDKVPNVAKNWPAGEQKKCASAAQSVLSDGGSERDAIYACIHAAGRSERSHEMPDTFFIPTEDSASGVMIFPIGKFYRDGIEREFTREAAAEIKEVVKKQKS